MSEMMTSFLHLIEPDMSRYSRAEWDGGLCVRVGDEPSGVQFFIRHSFLDVRTCKKHTSKVLDNKRMILWLIKNGSQIYLNICNDLPKFSTKLKHYK